MKTSKTKERGIIMSRKRTKYGNKFKVKLVLEVLKPKKTLNPYALALLVRNSK